MSSGFGTDPAAAGPAAEALRAVAADLEAAAVALRAACGAPDAVCGADEQGRAFAAGYVPRAQEGLRAVDALARALGSLPAAIGDDAAAFVAWDRDGARELGGR